MGTHYKGSKKEVDALNVYIKLLRAAESVGSRVNSNLSKKGLTESQFSILEALFHIGPMCQRELADKLLKSGGNITLVVDNLEKQELVKRERTERDRRYYSIVLTEKGRSLIEDIFPGHLAAIVDEVSSLSEEEQHQLERMCKAIGIRKTKEERTETAAS